MICVREMEVVKDKLIIEEGRDGKGHTLTHEHKRQSHSHSCKEHEKPSKEDYIFSQAQRRLGLDRAQVPGP